MPLTAKQLARAAAFEEAWDSRLGGAATRGYREIGLFALARLILYGAQPEDVLDYLHACFEQEALRDDDETPDGGRA